MNEYHHLWIITSHKWISGQAHIAAREIVHSMGIAFRITASVDVSYFLNDGITRRWNTPRTEWNTTRQANANNGCHGNIFGRHVINASRAWKERCVAETKDVTPVGNTEEPSCRIDIYSPLMWHIGVWTHASVTVNILPECQYTYPQNIGCDDHRKLYFKLADCILPELSATVTFKLLFKFHIIFLTKYKATISKAWSFHLEI